jgi:hypothetical protein
MSESKSFATLKGKMPEIQEPEEEEQAGFSAKG